MRRLVYGATEPPGDVLAAVRRIKGWIRAALTLPADTTLSISELACPEPGCPPRETVILVMPAGRRAMKYAVHKALADVIEDDIRACANGPPLLL